MNKYYKYFFWFVLEMACCCAAHQHNIDGTCWRVTETAAVDFCTAHYDCFSVILLSSTIGTFHFISSRAFSRVSGASQQHHPFSGPDSYTALQSGRKPTTDHPLAEERCPCGPGAGTDNHPQNRGRIQAPHPGPGYNRHWLLSVCRLKYTQGHLCHRCPLRQTW